MATNPIEEVVDQIVVLKAKIERIKFETIERYLLKELEKMPPVATGIAIALAPRREDTFSMMEDCAFVILQAQKDMGDETFLVSEYGRDVIPLLRPNEFDLTPIGLEVFEDCVAEDPKDQMKVFLDFKIRQFRESWPYRQAMNGKGGLEAAEKLIPKSVAESEAWAKEHLDLYVDSGMSIKDAIHMGGILDKLSENLSTVLGFKGIRLKNKEGGWLSEPILLVVYRDERGVQVADVDHPTYNDCYE